MGIITSQNSIGTVINCISGAELLSSQWKATLSLINLSAMVVGTLVRLGLTATQDKMLPMLATLAAATSMFHFCKAYLDAYVNLSKI